MLLKYIKFFLIITIVYQSPSHSKSKTFENINSRYLSNYFSGIVAYENENNLQALKFFKSSKYLIDKHDMYLKRYIFSLVLESKVQEAINELKFNFGKNNSNFFESYLLLSLDSLKKSNFKKSLNYLLKSEKFIEQDNFKVAIYESLKQYIYVFENKKIQKKGKKIGKMSLINQTFQNCYLGKSNTDTYFMNLINDDYEEDLSRYKYFYVGYLIDNNRNNEARDIVDKLNYLNSTLLISQGKNWIEKNQVEEFNKIFSCKNHAHIVSEFLFLVGNLYSGREDYKRSNFYLNISNFLNPKFKFNLSLMAENYFQEKNYKKTKEILKNFNKKDVFYHWFAIKKKAQIISKKKNNDKSLNFLNAEFKKIEKSNIKMLFDLANFHKNSKKYEDAIIYYDRVIVSLNKNSIMYADILYRIGGSHERMGNHLKSDENLLKSLAINPDDAYVLNYLAYSWLEREYKITEAIKMLEYAYSLKSNDPYIIDSIGWAYYLVGDFLKAEKHLKRAVELMPNDPTVNDHYGDILWKLDRKIQARYFWKSVLKFEDTEDKMKKIITEKLNKGPKSS